MPVWDADAAVHRLYAAGRRRRGGAGRRSCPAAVRGGRGRPRAPARRRSPATRRCSPRIEARIHPLVAADRAAFVAGHAERGPAGLRHPAPLRDRRRARGSTAVLVVTAPAGGAARAGAGAAGHDRGGAGADPRAADARRREARPGRFRHRDRQGRRGRPRRRPIVAGADQGAARRCVRSCSTPRPPGSIPTPATGSSRSARSSSSTTCRRGGASTPTSTRSATCRQEAVEVHGLTRRRSSPTSRSSRAVAAEFAAFLGDARLVIHNAAFDMKFLNAELGWAGPAEPALGAGGRHAGAGAAALSRRAEQPRRALPPLRRRQLRPREARGAARTPSCWPRSISS